MNELMRLSRSFSKEGKALDEGKRRQLEKIARCAGILRNQESSALRVRRIAIAVDATGSMSNVWSAAKQCIRKFLERLRIVAPDTEVVIVAYRDYCDDNLLIETCPGTSDAEVLEKYISRMRCTGGGDAPEAVEAALEQILHSEVALGILIGDAPPHGVTDSVCNGKDFRQIAQQLGQAGIPVYTVTTERRCRVLLSSFKEIAELTGGRTMPLEDLENLLDTLSVAVADHLKKVPELVSLIKKEQGGRLTDGQKKLLALPWLST